MKNTTNVFLKGMQSDKHPLTTSQQEYTEAMNATLVTFNGNEQMLQNDMGNTRIQDAKTGNIMGLREGFTPVGLEEHGGIMYIASVNKEGVGEIGTIPSPIIKYTKEKDEKPKEIQLQFSYKESPAVRLSETILYPEDKFLISIDDSDFEITKKYSVNVYNTDSSGNESNSTLTYPYISKNMPNLQDELEYRRGLYKINLYAQTKGDTICLNNIVNDLNIIYKDNPFPNNENYKKYYQFACDNLNDNSNSNVDIEKMINEDGNTSVDYFLHYPCIAPGKIAISTEPENIESFSLIENYTNELDGKGQIYPITLESRNNNQSYNYYSAIQGFIYKTESAVHVNKLEIQINNGDTTKIEVNKGNFKRYKISDNEYLICSKDIAQDFDNDTKKSWLVRRDYNDNDINEYLSNISLQTSLNQNINLKVKYYCTDISEDAPLGTYELNYNPYYFDQAKPYLQEVYWEPHTYYDSNSIVSSQRDITTSDDTIDIKDDAGNIWKWTESISTNKYEGETITQTINLGGNRDGNDRDDFIKANDVDGSIQFPSRFAVNKQNPKIPDPDFRSSYLYLDRITESTIKNEAESKLTITDISLTFAIKSDAHHISNSNQIYNYNHYGFTKQAQELISVKFKDRPFIRGEHYYPGLKFKIKCTYGNNFEKYLRPSNNTSDDYFNLWVPTPKDTEYRSDAPLVWFIQPEYETGGSRLNGSVSWAYFKTPTPYTVALNEQVKKELIDKLQSDLNSVKSGETFNPTITLYIEDIYTRNIDHFIPNSVEKQNMQIQITVNLKFESEGYTVKYMTENKSKQQIYPQYDLWGISTDGFDSKIVPVYYYSTNKTFIESNIDTTNLIDLSQYSRDDNTSIKTSLMCDYIYPFSDKSFSVTIPKTGYYYIQGTKLNGNNGYSILEVNDFTVQNSSGNPQNYIYKFNEGNPAIITVKSGILVNQIGIYEYLGSEDDTPIKQSCINYYENKSDYWSKKTGASGVASTKYGEKKYNIRIIQAEGNQESYLQVDSDTKPAPILNSDTQSITLREGKSGLSLSDMIINTNLSNPNIFKPVDINPANPVLPQA